MIFWYSYLYHIITTGKLFDQRIVFRGKLFNDLLAFSRSFNKDNNLKGMHYKEICICYYFKGHLITHYVQHRSLHKITFGQSKLLVCTEKNRWYRWSYLTILIRYQIIKLKQQALNKAGYQCPRCHQEIHMLWTGTSTLFQAVPSCKIKSIKQWKTNSSLFVMV